MDDFVKKIRSKRFLYDAWKTVRSNGLRSQSEETKKQIREYESDVLHHIDSLSARLRNPTSFHFAPARGVPIPRKGNKGDRPIVVATTDTKVVQRAILNVLQSIPEVRSFVETPRSFGGIRERSVQQAVKCVLDAIEAGSGWFARSDIKDFFVNIDRSSVVSRVRQLVGDGPFLTLFQNSLETELSNLAELREKRKLFPIEEIGVAQGSSLSPFAGNVLLHDFDIEMNRRGIVCVRYIDDFVLLAPTQRNLQKALRIGLKMLSDLGLSAYDPSGAAEKGSIGQTKKETIEFLGIEIDGGDLRPSNASRQRLIENIDGIIEKSIRSFAHPDRCYKEKASIVRTLSRIDDTLQGWVTQYDFCNDSRVIERVNSVIDNRLREYLGRYRQKRSGMRSDGDRRKILGVRWLDDSDWGYM